MRGAYERIVEEVTAWPDITTEPGRFGATVFMHKRRELGHIHGDSVVDIPCRKEQAEAWIAASRAERHRFAPRFGVSVFLRTEADVINAIALLRDRHEGLGGSLMQ